MSAPERVFVGDGLPGPGRRPRALAVSAGRVTALGPAADVLAAATPSTQVVELPRGVVLPGFHDAHLHLCAGAIALLQLDLRDTADPGEAARRVGERARSLPAGTWVRGFGWDQSGWPGGTWPDRRVLDRAAPDHPVFLSRVDGHVAWLNSAGLRAAGIDAGTPDPPGGRILRETGGTPSGVLLETAAERARAALPADSAEDRRRALALALAELAAHGITSVEDVVEEWALDAYAGLRERCGRTVRISAWLPLDSDRVEAESWRRRCPPDDPWLRVATLKVFLDGTLGARTAALAEPYADEPANRGELRVEPGRLREDVLRADDAGWAVAMHAIGDRAVRAALDAVEALPARERPRPHRIEHVQVVAPSDLDRLARLGVAASVQPVHLDDDAVWLRARLGPARAARSYPWRSLCERGVTLALGTDWPVASLDPRRNLQAAVRRPAQASAAEALDARQAVEAYTLGAARAAGVAAQRGALVPGRLADFVVWSHDPACADPPARVLQTWVGGRRVHPDPERDAAPTSV